MIEARVTCRREDLAAVEAMLERFGAQAITLEDAGETPVPEPAPGQTPMWRDVAVSALFAASDSVDRLRAALREGAIGARAPTIERVRDRDWVKAWQETVAPRRFGARVWVCPHGSTPPEPGAINVDLDPGLAFGTGAHATTALCLEWLDAHPPVGLEVVDYGCGSGLLTLAALALGARYCRSVDTDVQALEATRANAERNAVAAERYALAFPQGLSRAPADLVIANILSRTLMELSPRLLELVSPGGHLVLSGILTGDQAQQVIDCYGDRCRLAVEGVREGWALLAGRKS